MEKTVLTSDGLKNALKNFTVEESVIEYIWNGFDANADTIFINEVKNSMNGTDYIEISDNGSGIARPGLDIKFKPIFQSEKLSSNFFKNDVNIKGKKGIGRLSFYNTAYSAKWLTTYNDGAINKKYSISVSGADLTSFVPSDEIETTTPTGTTVYLYFSQNINFDNVVTAIAIEYAWYLNVYKSKKIIINGKQLDFSFLLVNRDSKKGDINDIQYEIEICVWTQKLNEEYSKYYYLDDNSEVKFKENTTLNNKGDSFYHSVLIKSNLFDDFVFESSNYETNLLGAKNKNCASYKALKAVADELLNSIRKKFIRKYTSKFIIDLKKAGHYPKYDKNNVVDVFKEEQLDDMVSNIYYFEPKIFSSLSNI